MPTQESTLRRFQREVHAHHERRQAREAPTAGFELFLLVVITLVLFVSFAAFWIDIERAVLYCRIYLGACLCYALLTIIAVARDAEMTAPARVGFAAFLFAFWGLIGSVPWLALYVLAS